MPWLIKELCVVNSALNNIQWEIWALSNQGTLPFDKRLGITPWHDILLIFMIYKSSQGMQKKK